jgi:hypothetical protein
MNLLSKHGSSEMMKAFEFLLFFKTRCLFEGWKGKMYLSATYLKYISDKCNTVNPPLIFHAIWFFV